jgi:hypothetical protein
VTRPAADNAQRKRDILTLHACQQELRRRESILGWLDVDALVNESGQPFTLAGHEFQRDLLTDTSPLLAVQKCSQVGVSTAFIIKCLYLLRYRRMNIIYTLPTLMNDVQKFVPSKVDPMLLRNRIKPVRDTIAQKQFANGFWFFASTFGEKEGIMITGDVLVHDELDRSNLDVVETFKSRLGHSKYRWRWYFSNPSYPSDSPDRPNVNYWYNRSDQKHWFVKCDCGQGNYGGWQYLEWPDSFDEKRRIYVCRHCGREITAQHIKDGRWVAKYPGRDVSGYWISRMCAPWVTAADIIDEFSEAKSLGYFYNFVLGLPYMAADVVINRSIIMSNLTETKPDGAYCMGIDVGEKLHIVVGTKAGIVHVAEGDWQTAAQLVQLFDPRQIVIDAQPEVTKAKEFAAKFPGRVLRCYYREERLGKPAQVNTFEVDWKDGTVSAWRTECIDRLLADLAGHKVLYYQGQHLSAAAPEFAGGHKKGAGYVEHFESLYLVKDENEVRRWEHSGPDHYAHATVYWWLARQLVSDGEYKIRVQ